MITEISSIIFSVKMRKARSDAMRSSSTAHYSCMHPSPNSSHQTNPTQRRRQRNHRLPPRRPNNVANALSPRLREINSRDPLLQKRLRYDLPQAPRPPLHERLSRRRDAHLPVHPHRTNSHGARRRRFDRRRVGARRHDGIGAFVERDACGGKLHGATRVYPRTLVGG